MDCEKFENALIDELYGELDELTSAASKRHVAGCARCATLLSGLKATRRVAMLPVVAPSEGFEDRILAAAKVARAASKPKLGFAEIISWGGQWAMRPQTAMAAVFLLIVGTSSVLLTHRSSRTAAAPGSAAFSNDSFSVTENGAPDLPAAERAASQWIDPGAAAAAHGEAPRHFAARPAATTAASAPGEAPLPNEEQQRMVADLEDSKSATDPARRAVPRMSAPSAGGQQLGGGGGGGVGAIGGLKGYDEKNAYGHAAGPQAILPPPPPAAAAPGAPAAPAKKADDSAFATGRSQYAARDYAGAQQTFDGLAAQGDVTSALWAARSLRDGAGGCAAAAPRFDLVAGQAWGSTTGYDATLEGGECYRALGQADVARTRFARLLTVPAYASRAQADIDAMSQVASRSAAKRPAAKPVAAQPAAPPQANPPQGQQAPATPPAASY